METKLNSETERRLFPDPIMDQTAFALIYNRYCDVVYANILRLVKAPGHAEDILQDVFVQLWESRNKLNDRSIAGWLFVVSHNKSMDFLKQSVKVSLSYVADYHALSHLAMQQDDQEEIYLQQLHLLKEAVAQLPLRMRRVFQLCRYEGKSKEEVALLLGISANSVADYLKQANKVIRNYIHTKYPYLVSSAVLIAIALAVV
ncbi:sigma-70 family RNA polymerase sigma factor [Sphingobacterium sp. Mn56C]|uniref:sigma-70 family RNA polymerase sigma factor n=1 Tax=Sphingobacterium sp. Mn56C TaxID=3395261 RepID=UPI003BDA1B12